MKVLNERAIKCKKFGKFESLSPIATWRDPSP